MSDHDFAWRHALIGCCICVGKEFYGPDGVYPFAGHECARAFALTSTEIKDCNNDLEGFGPMEMESLRDWEGRFWNKYKMVGRVVHAKFSKKVAK